MRVVIAEKDVFIPTWNDNKNLPEDEQIKVHYKFPTQNQRNRYITRYPAELESGKNAASGQNTIRMKIETDDKMMFKLLVTKIENLEWEDHDGQIHEIKKPDELFDARGLDALYDEIIGHLFNAQAVQVKN